MGTSFLLRVDLRNKRKLLSAAGSIDKCSVCYEQLNKKYIHEKNKSVHLAKISFSKILMHLLQNPVFILIIRQFVALSVQLIT